MRDNEGVCGAWRPSEEWAFVHTNDEEIKPLF
jgi:hypothetical protein